MVFTKREKIIIAATIFAVCVLVLDFYVFSPAFEKYKDVQEERRTQLEKLNQAERVLDHCRLVRPRWQAMVGGGLHGDAADSEGQILRALRDWSAREGVRLSSLRPERSREKKELPEITVHVAGAGSMASISRLLWRIETTSFPVRIRMLQLGSRKDGRDDLSVHLKLSTLYLPSESAAQTAGSGTDVAGETG